MVSGLAVDRDSGVSAVQSAAGGVHVPDDQGRHESINGWVEWVLWVL